MGGQGHHLLAFFVAQQAAKDHHTREAQGQQHTHFVPAHLQHGGCGLQVGLGHGAGGLGVSGAAVQFVQALAKGVLQRFCSQGLVPAGGAHGGDDFLRAAAGLSLVNDPAAQFNGDNLGRA